MSGHLCHLCSNDMVDCGNHDIFNRAKKIYFPCFYLTLDMNLVRTGTTYHICSSLCLKNMAWYKASA